MMSPSALYLTCVSARSCPDSRIGLMVVVCEGKSDGGIGGGEAAAANFGDSADIDGLVLEVGCRKSR
jgi:hypothetical protein